MKLDEAIREAANTPPGHQRGKRVLDLINHMRNKLCYSYVDCALKAKQAGIDSARWEEKLAEADDFANGT